MILFPIYAYVPNHVLITGGRPIFSLIALLLQGAGIVWPTGFGNLEANWCRILSSQASDRLKTGFQLGFSGRW